MNNEVLRYKYRFLSCCLLFSYTFIHTRLTGVFVDVPLETLMDFSARLPYGQRLLLPTLAYLITHVLPLSVADVFFLLEWLFVSLFYFALHYLMQEEFTKREAQLLSWLCILLLPLVTVVNYRFPSGGAAAIFYPYDTATLFFMALGFLFCLRAQWFYFVFLVFITTFNRETSILIVLLIPGLYWQRFSTLLKPFGFSLLAYLLARLVILLCLKGTNGQLVEWYFNLTAQTHFAANLIWLFAEQNIFLVIFCFAGLPLFWFVFFDYIPLRYRPLRYVLLFYFLIMWFVGNFMEARIFSECLIIFYLPVCVALKNWLAKRKPANPQHPGLIYYMDRYAVLSIFILLVILSNPMNKLVIWFH